MIAQLGLSMARMGLHGIAASTRVPDNWEVYRICFHIRILYVMLFNMVLSVILCHNGRTPELWYCKEDSFLDGTTSHIYRDCSFHAFYVHNTRHKNVAKPLVSNLALQSDHKSICT